VLCLSLPACRDNQDLNRLDVKREGIQGRISAGSSGDLDGGTFFRVGDSLLHGPTCSLGFLVGVQPSRLFRELCGASVAKLGDV